MANFIWYELLADDLAAAQDFYAAVLGWQVCDSGIAGIDYRIVATTEGEAIGGLMQRPAGSPGGPVWLGYLPVVDVDRSLGAIVEDGGSVLMPAWTMEGVGRMALVSDPLGAPFYIMASEDERPSRAFAEHGTAPRSAMSCGTSGSPATPTGRSAFSAGISAGPSRAGCRWAS